MRVSCSEDVTEIQDYLGTAKELNEYFTLVFSEEEEVEKDVGHRGKISMDNGKDAPELEITITKMEAKFKDLNTVKLRRPDNFHLRVLKDFDHPKKLI